MAEPARDDNSSPHQLSFDLHPYLNSIEAIADQHGLHHDSGVAFGGASGSQGKTLNPSTASTSKQRPERFLLTASGSSSSLKRPSTSAPEGGDPRAKRIIESPGVTGEFDARADTWFDVARRLKPFGDTLRHERLRSTLGETSLGKDCVGLLLYSNGIPRDLDAIAEAQIEMLRILANLCIDHDENRERLLEVGAPQAIAVLVQEMLASDERTFHLDIISLLRTAAGALLNMQLDHPSTREALRRDPKTVESLFKLATDGRIYHLGDWYIQKHGADVDGEEWKKHVSTGARVTTWAWRIIQDVCAGDEEEEGEGNAKSEDEEKAIESLVSIGRLSAVCYMVQPLEWLLTSSQTATAKGGWDADDVCDMMESDMDIVQIATELIESCSLDSRQFRIAALDELPSTSSRPGSQRGTMLELLVHFLDVCEPPAAWSSDRSDTDNLPPKPSDDEAIKEVITNFSRAKAAIARAIVSIVGEDENMIKLFEGQGSGQGGWFTETMKEWMMRDPKIYDVLVSTAMLAVGNLARKDAHCIALVHEHNLAPTLTALLVPSADIKVTHGIVCLLKNLAIPAQNKRPIGSSNDLIARLAPFLEAGLDKVQPLQFATVGLLKHLCAGNIDNAQDFVLKDTLSVLLALLQRTDDVPTRMEGTRVLVNAIKTLWSASSGIASATVRREARKTLTCEPVVLALADMVKSSTKYPVLVNEGILALTLLASGQDQQPNGAQLVAKALQTILPSRKTSGSSEGRPAQHAAANQGETGGEAEQTEGGLSQPKLPQRQTTLDALASTTTQVLPTPRTGADMVATVLFRRDARMPPQFANNACALVQTLVQGGKGNGDLQRGGDSDFVGALLQAWLPALEQLSDVGPQETLPIAQRALQSVKSFSS